MYLQSSNMVNSAFYHSHGFKTVGAYLLGGDNPEWSGKPIRIEIVSGLCNVQDNV